MTVFSKLYLGAAYSTVFRRQPSHYLDTSQLIPQAISRIDDRIRDNDFGINLTGNYFESGSYTTSLKTFIPTSSTNPTILNGGFETDDLTGWTTLGKSSIQTSVYGSGTTEGCFEALLSIGGTTLADSILERFLGLDLRSLNHIPMDNAFSTIFEQEPNDSFDTSQVIPRGIGNVNGRIDENDVDFFKFSNLNAGDLFIAQVGSNTFDPLLGLVNDSGNILAINDDKSDNSVLPLLTGKIPASGNLDLAVTGLRDINLTGDHFESGSYTLSLKTFSLPTPSTNPTLLNGGFETGNLTGWATLGESSIQTSAFGSSPTEGRFEALLSTGGTTFADSILEEFIGLNSGSLDNIANQNIEIPLKFDATEGSAIRQTFTAKAGDILSFDWNFLHNFDIPDVPTLFNDFAFVSINSVSALAKATSPLLMTSMTPFSEETGFQTFSYTIPTTGQYSLGIGVVDVGPSGIGIGGVGDRTVDSGLLVDNVTLTSGTNLVI